METVKQECDNRTMYSLKTRFESEKACSLIERDFSRQSVFIFYKHEFMKKEIFRNVPHHDKLKYNEFINFDSFCIFLDISLKQNPLYLHELFVLTMPTSVFRKIIDYEVEYIQKKIDFLKKRTNTGMLSGIFGNKEENDKIYQLNQKIVNLQNIYVGDVNNALFRKYCGFEPLSENKDNCGRGILHEYLRWIIFTYCSVVYRQHIQNDPVIANMRNNNPENYIYKLLIATSHYTQVPVYINSVDELSLKDLLQQLAIKIKCSVKNIKISYQSYGVSTIYQLRNQVTEGDQREFQIRVTVTNTNTTCTKIIRSLIGETKTLDELKALIVPLVDVVDRLTLYGIRF